MEDVCRNCKWFSAYRDFSGKGDCSKNDSIFGMVYANGNCTMWEAKEDEKCCDSCLYFHNEEGADGIGWCDIEKSWERCKAFCDKWQANEKCCGSCRMFYNEDADGVGECRVVVGAVECGYFCDKWQPKEDEPVDWDKVCRNCKHIDVNNYCFKRANEVYDLGLTIVDFNSCFEAKEGVKPLEGEKLNTATEYEEHVKPVNEMIDKISSVCADIEKTLISKNTDYGNSFQETLCKYGDVAFMVRLEDKWARLDSLYGKQEVLVKDESFEDTIRDMAGYCLLYLAIKKQEELS